MLRSKHYCRRNRTVTHSCTYPGNGRDCTRNGYRDQKKKKRKKKNVRPVTLHEDKVRERFYFSP
jgi:hypothetical protein